MVSGPYHCGCLCSLIGFAAFGQLLRSVHRFVPLGLLVARLSCETAHDRIGDSGGARSHPTRLQVVATLSLQSRGLVGRRHRPVGKWKRRLKLGCRRYTRRRYWLTRWLPGIVARTRVEHGSPTIVHFPSWLRVLLLGTKHYLLASLSALTHRFESM